MNISNIRVWLVRILNNVDPTYCVHVEGCSAELKSLCDKEKCKIFDSDITLFILIYPLVCFFKSYVFILLE